MAHRIHFGLLFTSLTIAGLSTPAQSRLHEVTGVFNVEQVTTVHLPTGCNARLEFQDEILIAASIVDPLCLPKGVKTRNVPPFKKDFYLPREKRGRFDGEKFKGRHLIGM